MSVVVVIVGGGSTVIVTVANCFGKSIDVTMILTTVSVETAFGAVYVADVVPVGLREPKPGRLAKVNETPPAFKSFSTPA